MNNDLVVFKKESMILAYRPGPMDFGLERMLPYYNVMTKKDQGILEDALKENEVVIYFIKEKEEVFEDMPYVFAESPLFGELAVKHDGGRKDRLVFKRPVIQGGQVLTLPKKEYIPFLAGAFAFIEDN